MAKALLFNITGDKRKKLGFLCMQYGITAVEGTGEDQTRLLSQILAKEDQGLPNALDAPFADEMLQKILGDRTELLDGGPGVARQTKRRLEAAGLLHEGPGELLIENSMPGDTMIKLSRRLAGLE